MSLVSYENKAGFLTLSLTYLIGSHFQEDVVPDIQGKRYGPATDLQPGMAVCVYCEDNDSDSRPWLGEVKEVHEESLEFTIHWYQVSHSFSFTFSTYFFLVRALFFGIWSW